MAVRRLVVWNGGAGRATDAAMLLQEFQQDPHSEVVDASSNDEATELVRRRGEEWDVVVAAGGDGTINAIVNGLMHCRRRPTLAVLPIGTANDFSASIGMSDDLVAAMKQLSAAPRRLDIGEMRTAGRSYYFANVAAGGNSGRVTANLTPELKERWGPLCYLRGALPLLSDLVTYRVQLRIDGESTEELELLNVIVANGRTNAGRLPVAPQANLEDGHFDLVLIRDGTITELAGLATRFALSDYLQSDKVVFRRARELEMITTPSLPFSIDGDLIEDEVIGFRIHPGALSVVVGETYVTEP